MAGGAAAAAIGGVGSLLNMGAQQRAASQQRKQIDIQLKQARQDMVIQRERFEITKAAAADQYFRERILLDNQKDLGRLQQEEQRIMQAQHDQALSFQQEQLKHSAQQQVSQILQSKANAQTQAQMASAQGLRSLAERFMQSEQLGEQLYTQLAGRGVNIEGYEAMREQDNIRALQAGVEGVNTIDRQRAYAEEMLEGQAGLVQSQAKSSGDYLASTRKYQQMMNEMMQRYGTQDMEYTYRRNLLAAEANKYAQQAGILGQEGASQLQYRNQVNQSNIASTQIQSPNWLAGILSVGAQFAPQIASGVQGLFNNTATVSSAAPHVGGGGMLNPVSSGLHVGTTNPGVNIPPSFYTPGILTDVTGNIYG